jgi:two-component system chemotaxis sensor kinase CheA
VVEYNGGRAGLAADELLGDQQAVIKPLPMIFKSVPGVSGSTILGNGRVALILDVPALLCKFRTREVKEEVEVV